MGNQIELRTCDARVEVRATADGDKPKVVGYAAKFNKLSHPLGFMKFREKIDPGAFDETLAQGADVRFTLNHNPDKVMGRTAAGTLKLSTDETGLRYELDPPDTQMGRDFVESVKRGDLSNSSFKFRTLDDDWSEDKDGNPIRTLKKVSLHDGDVAAVTYPAYPDTEVNVRSLDAIVEEGLKRIHPESRDAKKPYGDVDYADPGYQSDGVHRYPLDTVEHIKAAWDYIHKSDDAAKYTADQVSKIKAKIVAAWKAKIDKDGPPSAESKSANDDVITRAAAERDRDLALAGEE